MSSETMDNNQKHLIEDIEKEVKSEVKRTSLGEWLLENSKIFFAIVISVTVLALAWAFYQNWSSKQAQESSSKVYLFSENVLKAFSDKKIEEDKVISAFRTLVSEVSTKEAIVPVALELSNLVTNKSAATAELLNLHTILKPQDKGRDLISIQLASLYEDNGEAQKSIEILEKQKAQAPEYLAEYIYLNLGRLYIVVGNNDKAKSELTYLTEKFKDSEEAKLAAIMLSEL